MRDRSKQVKRDADGLPVFHSGEEFDALSDADKEKVWKYYDRVISKSELRDPTPEEAALIEKQRRHNRKVGRPKIGKGTKMVAVTIEKIVEAGRRLCPAARDQTRKNDRAGASTGDGQGIAATMFRCG